MSSQLSFSHLFVDLPKFNAGSWTRVENASKYKIVGRKIETLAFNQNCLKNMYINLSASRIGMNYFLVFWLVERGEKKK